LRQGDKMRRVKGLAVLVATIVMLALATVASFPWDVTRPHF
jgi:hypothetical protein